MAVLDWYAEIARSARKALLMTFAFGMHKNFTQVYQRDDRVLRFALMEKEGNGPGLAEAGGRSTGCAAARMSSWPSATTSR
jgi:hypothetical protein